MLSPSLVSPVGLLKVATAIWASTSLTPLEKTPDSVPSWPIANACSVPADWPFWVSAAMVSIVA